MQSYETITICVIDYWQQRHYIYINNNNQNNSNAWNSSLQNYAAAGNEACKLIVQKYDKSPTKGYRSLGGKDEIQAKSLKTQSSATGDGCGATQLGRRLRQTIDAISAFYVLRELTDSNCFRDVVIQRMSQHSAQLLYLELVPPSKDIIDYKFNRMLSHIIWERVEVEHLMSWLSTLGGGYSALGEQFDRCAETAGKISLKQLSIGYRLGDPFLQARCMLYFSISLIQRGHLRAAKRIIRRQYKFASKNREQDERLIKMCHGVWLRLCYEYSKRKERLIASGSAAGSESNANVVIRRDGI